MHKQHPFTEVDLHAYVDGQLSAERCAQIENCLAEDAEARKRVQRYQELNQSLRTHFAPVLDEPIPRRLLRRAPARSGFHPRSVAAAVGWLLVGSVVGATLQF
jgi:anti-sigma factor RsiW